MTEERKKTVCLSVHGDVIKGEVTNMSHDEVLHVLVSAAIDQAKALRRSVCVKCILSGFGFDMEGRPDED